MIQNSVIGTYVLICDGQPFYVGRSDSCLRTRLGNHELLAAATHVLWEPCATTQCAFRLEAAWFHGLHGTENFRNLIHPARPLRDSPALPFLWPTPQPCATACTHGIHTI